MKISYDAKKFVAEKEFPFMLTQKHLMMMGFSRNAVYTMFGRSDFPCVQYGNRRYFRRDKFFAWLEQREGGTI